MKGKISFFIFMILISFAFWQCTETKEIDPNELGAAYFPLHSGTFRIYRVEGTSYKSAVDSTIFFYFLKETTADAYENLANGISYKIQRFKGSNDQGPWKLDSIWTARKDERTAVMVENNIPIVKLSFPIREHVSWDGNSLNDRFEDEFEMINVGQPYNSVYNSFDKTVTVIQEDLPDLVINTISRKEIYGENVGLIYKENINLKYISNTGIITSGIKYFQHLVEYGEE